MSVPVKMAEKKKGKKRKEEYVLPGEEKLDKPTKDEFQIANWMRRNVPIKKTKFINHNVEYFTACRAVDAILQSKWTEGDDALFKTREEIVDYLHLMLIHKFFHRARKVPVSDTELRLRNKKDKKSTTTSTTTTTTTAAQSTTASNDNNEKGTDAESSVVEGKTEQPPIEKEKRKKKIRLEMHNDQRFVDGLDAYVWIYDPIPIHYWICGALLVIGAIGVCLFPLWPPQVRLGVYYISVAAAGFLITVIVLAGLRFVIFCLIWILTLGQHHLWILPNLTEDVGFFASFWPLYTYEYKGKNSVQSKSNKSKRNKKNKEKDSDAEEEDAGNRKFDDDATTGGINDKEVEIQTLTNDNLVDEINGRSLNDGNGTGGGGGASESESESSQRSSTGKDFEMVDQNDLDT